MGKLRTFVTLSPAPDFAKWLRRLAADSGSELLSDDDREFIATLDQKEWRKDPELKASRQKNFLMPLAAHYFAIAKKPDGRPLDSVARFHLGNGARLERINWLGDTSEKGIASSFGLMVNYLYDVTDIEKNHEALRQ